MQQVTGLDLLNFWEQSMNHTLIRRAIDLLCLVYHGKKEEEIASLSIGERDAMLLLLREWLFGPRLQNIAECPICSERIEWKTDIQDIQLQLPKPDNPPGEYLLEKDGYNILFRLPNSNDIADVIADNENRRKPEKLLEKLILDCKFKSEPYGINDLPKKILKAIDHRIEEENPQSNIFMSVKCVNCNHQWEIQFDIMSYLWSEINNWARHILQDVGTIAQTYGWSEQDILNMSPARRQIYLEMVNS